MRCTSVPPDALHGICAAIAVNCERVLQVYKAHLVEGRAPAGPAVDSARANLAATFVNAFVNAGFGTDKLVTPEPVSCPLAQSR